MKIGLSSYSLSQALSKDSMDLFGAMDFIRENGGEHIEIVPQKYFDPKALAPELAKGAKERGLDISSYTIAADFVKPTPEDVRKEIERVKQEVETAAVLGVTRMRHDAGWLPKDQATLQKFEELFPVFVDACGEIADYAAKYGITTSIENHGFFVQHSERVKRIVLAVGRDNFRTTMDVGNFLCVDEDPLCAAINNISIASMIHFKDFHIRSKVANPEGYITTTHGRFIRGAVTGDGDVDLFSIVKVIKNSGYDGYISIEFEGWDECTFACKRALKAVRNLFENE